jgi:hypothetical protein
MEKHEVKIFIDKVPKESPNPTTGHALYVLGNIDAQAYDLYRETRHGDDELIKDDGTQVHLHEGEHFFSSPKKINPGA